MFPILLREAVRPSGMAVRSGGSMWAAPSRGLTSGSFINPPLRASGRDSEANRENLPKHDQGDSDEEAVEWLWPASRQQMAAAEAHHEGTDWMLAGWRFSSKYELGKKFFDSVMEVMNNKVQPLRGLIRNKDAQPWVCASLTPGSDVQFLKGEDETTTQEEMQKLFTTGIPCTRTPLWKLLVIPTSRPSQSPIASHFTYEFDAYLRFHRALMDEPTVISTLGWFSNLMHKASMEEPVNFIKQHGVHLSGHEIEPYLEAIRNRFLNDPHLLKAKMTELRETENYPLLLQAFGSPGGKSYTKHVRRHLSPTVLWKFRFACAESGITVSSGLQAAINAGLVEIVKDKLMYGSYDITVSSNSSLRSYVHPHKGDTLGFLQSPVIHKMRTPTNVREDFWAYANKMSRDMRLMDIMGKNIEQMVLREMMAEEDAAASSEEHPDKDSPLADYGFLNAGNLSPIIPAHGDYISVSEVFLMSSVHRNPNYIMCHQINSYNGFIFYTMSYDAASVTDHTANVLADAIVAIIEEASNEWIQVVED